MSRQVLSKRLTRLEAIAPKKPRKILIVGLPEDAPDDFDGEIFLTGVPRPEDKLHRLKCE
jgi:hypothetical protein